MYTHTHIPTYVCMYVIGYWGGGQNGVMNLSYYIYLKIA